MDEKSAYKSGSLSFLQSQWDYQDSTFAHPSEVSTAMRLIFSYSPLSSNQSQYIATAPHSQSLQVSKAAEIFLTAHTNMARRAYPRAKTPC